MDIKNKSIWVVSLISAVLGSVVTTVTFALSPIMVPDFPDVDDNAYYTASVYRMAHMQVVRGYDNGNFGPNDPVSRAQFVTMLDRYDKNIIPLKGLMPTNDVWHLAYLICEKHRSDSIDETNNQLKSSYKRICENKIFSDLMDF